MKMPTEPWRDFYTIPDESISIKDCKMSAAAQRKHLFGMSRTKSCQYICMRNPPRRFNILVTEGNCDVNLCMAKWQEERKRLGARLPGYESGLCTCLINRERIRFSALTEGNSIEKSDRQETAPHGRMGQSCYWLLCEYRIIRSEEVRGILNTRECVKASANYIPMPKSL